MIRTFYLKQKKSVVAIYKSNNALGSIVINAYSFTMTLPAITTAPF